MLPFLERACFVFEPSDLGCPCALLPVVDDAIVAERLLDGLITSARFDSKAVWRVGTIKGMVCKQSIRPSVIIHAFCGLYCDLNSIQVLCIGKIVGRSVQVTPVRCLAAY